MCVFSISIQTHSTSHSTGSTCSWSGRMRQDYNYIDRYLQFSIVHSFLVLVFVHVHVHVHMYGRIGGSFSTLNYYFSTNGNVDCQWNNFKLTLTYISLSFNNFKSNGNEMNFAAIRTYARLRTLFLCCFYIYESIWRITMNGICLKSISLILFFCHLCERVLTLLSLLHRWYIIHLICIHTMDSIYSFEVFLFFKKLINL